MILPELEQQGLYNQIDFNKHMADQTEQVVTMVVSVYVCPIDAGGSNVVLDNRWTDGGPPRAMGLWYTGSMGPTTPSPCAFCPDPTPSPTNYCCQGSDYGTQPGYGYGWGSTVGVFGRYHKAISFNMVGDGLSNTIIVGEALPRQCCFISLFTTNFNILGTTIPLNNMESDEGT